MKPTVIILAFISLAGLGITFVRLVPARASSAFSTSGTESVREGTCVEHYNSLLNNAKLALIAGDRATTLNLLEQAKHMTPTCPALKGDAAPEPVLLSSEQFASKASEA
jgi:hypothetical protein